MTRIFGRLFLKLTLHDNRIEIVEGMFPFRKRRTIPLKNVASVEVSKLTRMLVIATNDGKTQAFAIGGFGKAQAAREAIAQRL